jgi:hypothetical protein
MRLQGHENATLLNRTNFTLTSKFKLALVEALTFLAGIAFSCAWNCKLENISPDQVPARELHESLRLMMFMGLMEPSGDTTMSVHSSGQLRINRTDPLPRYRVCRDLRIHTRDQRLSEAAANTN